ncbi:MAG: hypothetical protein D6748_02885 [Calditrichaeota bacterium]|nr:MAG: hypothetical protein D6748_02885 [Calditrichota bacterium]
MPSFSIKKAIGQTFITQLAIFLLVLLNNVLLSRWLGPALFGAMATILILTDAVNKLTNLGQETALLYLISGRKHPFPKLMGTFFVHGLVVFLLGTGVIVVLIVTGSLKLVFDPQEIQLISTAVWWSIPLFFANLVHDYGSKIWLGQQKFSRYNANLFFRPLIYLSILFFLYISKQLTVSTAIAGMTVSWFLPGIYIWLRSVLPNPFLWDIKIAREALGYGTKIMFSNLLGFLVYRSDIFLIGYFLSQQEVGWYYIAVLIAERLLYLTHASSTVLLPAASFSNEQQQKTPTIIRINLIIVLLGAILIALVSPWLIPILFSEQYSHSVLPLLFLLPGIVGITIPKILSADFASRGIPQYNLITSSVNFLVNLLLNLLLIPRIGIAGAAISSSFSYLVAAMIALKLYSRIRGLKISTILKPRKSDWEALKVL